MTGVDAGPAKRAARGTHEVILDMVRRLADCRRVLDVPCGKGAFTRSLVDRGYEVLSLDCVDELEVEGSTFLQGDMNERLPLDDGELDAVVCIDGIEHIERPYDFARECFRVLRPGGNLIVSTPNISSLRSRWRWLLTGFHHGRKAPLDETDPNPLHHINMLEFHKIRYMLHREGFRIAEIATNRTKAIAYLYAPLLPLSYLMTRHVFRREIRRPAVQEIAPEVRRQMFSKAVLFGDAIIVRAVR